jgi:hypothetical protein
MRQNEAFGRKLQMVVLTQREKKVEDSSVFIENQKNKNLHLM